MRNRSIKISCCKINAHFTLAPNIRSLAKDTCSPGCLADEYGSGRMVPLLLLICCLIGIYSSYAWSPISHAVKSSTQISRTLQQYKIPSQLFDTKNKEAITSSSTSSSAVSAASSSSSSASTIPYNWKEQWYAVTYASYLPK